MSNGNWTISDAVGVIAEANESRGVLTIQHYEGDALYLAFGDDVPEVGKGIRLSATFPLAVMTDYRASQKVSGVCDSGETCNGGYSEG